MQILNKCNLFTTCLISHFFKLSDYLKEVWPNPISDLSFYSSCSHPFFVGVFGNGEEWQLWVSSFLSIFLFPFLSLPPFSRIPFFPVTSFVFYLFLADRVSWTQLGNLFPSRDAWAAILGRRLCKKGSFVAAHVSASKEALLLEHEIAGIKDILFGSSYYISWTFAWLLIKVYYCLVTKK